MFCKNCGTKLKEGAKFCMSCGTQIQMNTPAPEVTEPIEKKENIEEQEKTELLVEEKKVEQPKEPEVKAVEPPKVIVPKSNPTPAVVVNSVVEEKAKKNLLPIIFGVIAVVIIAVLAYVFLFKEDSSGNVNNNDVVTNDDIVAEEVSVVEETADVETNIDNLLDALENASREEDNSSVYNILKEHESYLASLDEETFESFDVQESIEIVEAFILESPVVVLQAAYAAKDYEMMAEIFNVDLIREENQSFLIPMIAEMFVNLGEDEHSNRIFRYYMMPYSEEGMLASVDSQLALDAKYPDRVSGWSFLEASNYDKVTAFKNGMAKIGTMTGTDDSGNPNYLWGVMNEDGTVIVEPKYEAIGVYLEDLAAVKDHGQWGFINRSGVVVVPVMYDEIKDPNDSEFYAYAKRDPENIFKGYYNGFAAVKRGESWGFIDKNGQPLGPGIIYKSVQNFSEESGVVRIGDRWGLLNRNGNYIIKPGEENPNGIKLGVVRPIFEGLAGVNWNYGDNRGLINKYGELITSFDKRYIDLVQDFREGLASVRKVGSDDVARWGFINRYGDIVIPTQYETVTVFIDGVSMVSNNNNYGLINRSGREILALEYDNISGFQDGYAIVSTNGKKGIVDLNGNLVVEPIYQDINLFNNGVAGYNENGKWGLLNESGTTIVDPVYQQVKSFSNGLAPAKYDNKWGYIDNSGFFMVTPRFDYADVFHEGLALVKENNQNKYIKLDAIPGTVMAQVVDENNDPVKQASVTIHRQNDDIPFLATETDQYGMIKAVLPEGDFVFKTHYDNYIDMDAFVEMDEAVDQFMSKIIIISDNADEFADTEINLGNALNGQALNDVGVKFRAGYNNTNGEYLVDDNGDILVVYSDRNGLLSINLPKGAYTAETTLDGFNNNYINVIASSKLNRDIFQTRTIPMSETLLDDQIRVTLEWGSRPSDLDAHLSGPVENGYDRFHVYYPDKGRVLYDVILDKDDTAGNGFETFTLHELHDGTYTYSVFDYSNQNNYESSMMSSSGARVSVYMGNQLIATFDIPTKKTGILWEVFEIRGNRIFPINNVTNHLDSEFYSGN